MRLTLDYGREGLSVQVPDHARLLSMRTIPGLDEIEKRVYDVLQSPNGTPPLSSLARGCRDACVVISDITRPVPNSTILPPILATLEESGIAKDAITILVATGLHRPNEGNELVQLVGPEIAASYRIENHCARDREKLAYVGDTSIGAPIWVDKLYLDAELKIATSLIEPHLMAGYSGGRKAICPGLMGVDTMKILHGPELMGHPKAAEGIIEGNPFHQQALEVAKTIGVDFILNVALNEHREIVGLFSGELEAAHAQGIRFVEASATATIGSVADVVVTTSAGFPLDLTLYQAVKGMTAALPIVKDGGTIVIAASCDNGLGSDEFAELLLAFDGVDNFIGKIERPDFFVVDQWQLQELCKVIKKVKVKLYSETISQKFGNELPIIETISSVEKGIDQAMGEYGRNAPVVVIPQGPYVLPRVTSGPERFPTSVEMNR